jgi:hypothetical protein
VHLHALDSPACLILVMIIVPRIRIRMICLLPRRRLQPGMAQARRLQRGVVTQMSRAMDIGRPSLRPLPLLLSEPEEDRDTLRHLQLHHRIEHPHPRVLTTLPHRRAHTSRLPALTGRLPTHTNRLLQARTANPRPPDFQSPEPSLPTASLRPTITRPHLTVITRLRAIIARFHPRLRQALIAVVHRQAAATARRRRPAREGRNHHRPRTTPPRKQLATLTRRRP